MRDTLRLLSNYPELGGSVSFFSTIIGWTNIFNPILTFISLSIGIVIGLMTLYAKWSKK
tara:strand:- start:1047 stop:1223 length:177 start_codon:yes stop_codon:yes gene_type:complete